MQPEPLDREDASTGAGLPERRGPATGEKAGDVVGAEAPAEPPDLFTGSARRFYANRSDA